MVLTAYSALSPATNSSCHRHRRIKVLPTRSGSQNLRQLDTSNGCQDHTALPYAATSFVFTPLDRSRAKARPATVARAQRCRVHRIPPNVRDDGQRPSLRRDGRSCRSDLPDGLSEIFFSAGLDDPNQLESPREIALCAHAISGGVKSLQAKREPEMVI